MTGGNYQLTATRGAIEILGSYQVDVVVCQPGNSQILRQDFDDLEEAHRAVAEALVRYPDCEVRLIQGDAVLISAAPARSS